MKEILLERLRLKKEILLCETDPLYFMHRYVHCAHPTHGTIPFVPHSFQEEYISAISKGSTIVAAARQSGSSITTTLFLFWEGFFRQKTQGFTANKIDQAASNLQTIRHAYMTMPQWMRDYNPMVVNNKNRIELANGSMFLAHSSSPYSFRGMTISTVFMDNFSQIRSAEDVITSVMPAIHAHNGKVIIVSSGDGSEFFNDMFSDAAAEIGSFTAIRIVPDN